MVFSFFRKKNAEEDERQLPEPKAPRLVKPAPPPGSTPAPEANDSGLDVPAEKKPELEPLEFSNDSLESLDFTSTSVLEAIEVLEADTSEVATLLEEAAVLFSTGDIDETIRLLKQYADDDSHQAVEIWLMLFELYQMRNLRPAFDELAMRFVVKFLRSAPVWRDANSDKAMPAKAAPAGPAAAKAPAVGAHFALEGEFNAETLDARWAQFTPLAEKALKENKPIKFDFSKLTALDAAAATRLTQEWHKLSKAKLKVMPEGVEHLVAWLRTQVEMMRPNPEEMPFWVLLMECQQIMGDNEGFDNTAVDYAVTYEVSPPSWDPKKYPWLQTPAAKAAVAASAPKVEAAPVAAPEEDVCMLHGEITDSDSRGLDEIKAYAKNHQYMLIDMADLKRIDFVSAGSLLNVFIELTQQGKQITIRGAHELLVALFRMLGITDVVQVIKRK